MDNVVTMDTDELNTALAASTSFQTGSINIIATVLSPATTYSINALFAGTSNEMDVLIAGINANTFGTGLQSQLSGSANFGSSTVTVSNVFFFI